MGKVPTRLREVVYTLSPYQQTIMNGLWKDVPHKAAHWATLVRALPWPCCALGAPWGGQAQL